MALAEWTWTPNGGVHGLGLVHGMAIVPHYDDIRRMLAAAEAAGFLTLA